MIGRGETEEAEFFGDLRDLDELFGLRERDVLKELHLTFPQGSVFSGLIRA